MNKKDFDAVIVGSGPNGLAAAITLQQAGLSVLLIEAKPTIGGGLRSTELTLPGFTHDVCSAVHPLAADSPFFKTLPLKDHGLEYVYPELAAAHPFDNGSAAILESSLEKTAKRLDIDEVAYKKLLTPLFKDWSKLATSILGPFNMLDHPLALMRFGTKALLPASMLSKNFKTIQAQSLFSGMAAHSMLPLHFTATSAIALVLMLLGHKNNWPIPRGGSASIAKALASYFTFLGGKIETGLHISSLSQLPSAHALVFDVAPSHLLQIAGHKFSSFYKSQLKRYRYGMGVYKMDWALDAPIPFVNPDCRAAGTVHIGGTREEIMQSENMAWNGRHSEKPFTILAQPSVFDDTRAPAGKHVAWAYCHVPHGSTRSMKDVIERQIERFAPGFRERILARHAMNTADMQAYNPNYIGGDINGGAQNITQVFTRPALRLSPYSTSARGIYICSASTPPGGGVHGMCGYHAAKRVLKDIFNNQLLPLPMTD